MKGANLERLPVSFQLYDILEKAKLWRQWKDQWSPKVGGGSGDEETVAEDLCGSETAPCWYGGGHICHTRRYMTPRMKSNMNSGLWWRGCLHAARQLKPLYHAVLLVGEAGTWECGASCRILLWTSSCLRRLLNHFKNRHMLHIEKCSQDSLFLSLSILIWRKLKHLAMYLTSLNRLLIENFVK